MAEKKEEKTNIIEDKNKNLKTVSLHDKDYVMVNERVLRAHELYGNKLSIVTKLIEANETYVRMKAVVTLNDGDKLLMYTGHAEELRDDPTSMVNKTSALENCETSAIGRAMGALGIGILDSYATADEIVTANTKEKKMTDKPTEKQIQFISELYMRAKNKTPDEKWINGLTKASASVAINKLKQEQPIMEQREESPIDQSIGDELEEAEKILDK
jgi:hypothetical protein